jgi:DnaJ domain
MKLLSGTINVISSNARLGDISLIKITSQYFGFTIACGESKTRGAYFCYTCSEEVTFRGTRIRYNLDGSLHLCKADDKLAYEKYHEYICRDKTGCCFTGEDFWKWKQEIYDLQRWTQSRKYYNELKEQREREQQRAAEAVAEERRKAAEAEAQRRKAAEEVAEAQRREEQRKQAAREKRRAAREMKKQREQAEAEAAAKEAEARERKRQAEGRRRRRGSSRGSRSRQPRTRPGGRLEQALRIMGLTVDILRLSSKEAGTAIKNRFRTLAMKFHPDRGGDVNRFMAMNEAYEYLLHHLLNKI